ncbi:MAG: amidohydrolase family protein [Actinobacteria bacterium]|nr:amidohydrolase family protein [Actinomycetota bacterium]
MSAQLVIRGGTVIDGTGAPGVRADVAIENGRISAIGRDLEGDEVLDADEHIVAPGFIDIHTHYDAQVFWDPGLTPSCYHGVTTVVAGNCGFSIAPTRAEHRDLIARTLENVEDMDVAALEAGIPWDFVTFGEYLASVERHGLGLNYAAYIGHTALRLFVMGDDAYEREAKPDELAQMQSVLRDAMNAGAAGFATSFAPTHRGAEGKPVPSRFASRDEFEALLAVMGEVGRGVVAVAPGENVGIPALYDLQLAVGVPFTYGALLTSPNGAHRKLVEINDAGWERGAQVWPQVSPRPLTFAMTLAEPFTLNMKPSFAALMAGSLDARREAYADPEWRRTTSEQWKGMSGFGTPRWDTYDVAESRAHPELNGSRIADIARQRGTTPFDAVLDLALDEPDLALRVRAVLLNDDADEVAFLLAQEHCTLGLSDAGAHVGQLCDAPEPTDFLGNWVRDRGVVPLEAAVRKLTGVQADLFGLRDRGYLRDGAWADVVVFDPATVAPGPLRRVRDFPAGSERLTADQASGIRHLVVNGTPVQVDGTRREGARAGAIVRPPARVP